jgi:hypothetical protein
MEHVDTPEESPTEQPKYWLLPSESVAQYVGVWPGTAFPYISLRVTVTVAVALRLAVVEPLLVIDEALADAAPGWTRMLPPARVPGLVMVRVLVPAPVEIREQVERPDGSETVQVP